MSDLRPKIRAALNTFLEAQEGHHIKADVLRIIEEEALLLKQTELVKDAFSEDSLGQLDEVKDHVERLKKLVNVTSYNNVRTLDGYTRIDAVVTMGTATPHVLQLTFRYEQKRREQGPGCHIRYSIEFSKNYMQRENLIVVEVWAPQNGPSRGTAVCVNQTFDQSGKSCHDEDDDDGWEDMDEDKNEVKTETAKSNAKDSSGDLQTTKRQKLGDESQETPNDKERNGCSQQCQGDDERSQQTHEEFIAYLDPDLMDEFLFGAGLSKAPMDDSKAFFLLMTFPFYEHEFDLVGYLLDEIFGYEESEDSEDDKEK
jgi:hypothetical protein